ncbi:cation transporter [Paenibacillus athensensis]|uniref:Cation-efflux pump n=1 Tax=Paenibacillus athensensis TaxID=1967502 RepID=A0A4Y8Q3B3_9BACL|nr:cation transporter [Paenibacillus athensensis]
MMEDRLQKAQRAAWLRLVGHLGLAVLQGVAGWLAHSRALLADAVHSASAASGPAADLIGLRTDKLPPNESRSYRHGKAEAAAALLIAVALLVVGMEIGLAAVKALRQGVDAPPSVYAVPALLLAIGLKEVVYRYKQRTRQRQGLPAPAANVREHRSSLLSSAIALLGVLGALAGSYAHAPLFYYLDPLAGLLIALLLLRKGYSLAMDAIQATIDNALRREDAVELITAAQRVKGVITVDDLQAREHGHYVLVSVTISVNPRISVAEGHDIARSVKQQLMKRFFHVSDVFVHVHPYDPGYPYKNVDPEQDEFPSIVH